MECVLLIHCIVDVAAVNVHVRAVSEHISGLACKGASASQYLYEYCVSLSCDRVEEEASISIDKATTPPIIACHFPGYWVQD